MAAARHGCRVSRRVRIASTRGVSRSRCAQGETHLTIGITTPAAGASSEDETPITDADVVVTYNPLDNESEAVTVVAERQESLGIVYYEADAVLPAPGQWRVEVAVSGGDGSGTVAFEADVAAARRINSTLIAVVGGALVLGLLVLALRGRRAEAPSTTRRRPERTSRGRNADNQSAQQPNV